MKFTTLLLLGLSVAFTSTLIAQQNTSKIQKEANQIRSKEGQISFDYAEKLLELTQAHQKEKNFEKAATLDQEVSLILKTFADSIPKDYETEYAIKEELETILLEQYFTRWQGLMGQEKYTLAQQLILDKDWIKRSIKVKQYLDIINLFQVTHRTIGSQHVDYLANWEAAYFKYTSISYYNLQQARNLWKAITLHRAKETEEDSPAHIEVLFGYASFCNRTNDTETYSTLKTRIEKQWPSAFGNTNSSSEVLEENDKNIPLPNSKNEETDAPYTLVEQMPRFPGCEDFEGDNSEKKACADQNLLRFIYQNITYPDIARENGVEGMAVVRFMVTEYGTITDFKILRDPGSGCGREARRVMQLMNELPRRWTPGQQRGKKVRVIYNLPVRFKLN